MFQYFVPTRRESSNVYSVGQHNVSLFRAYHACKPCGVVVGRQSVVNLGDTSLVLMTTKNHRFTPSTPSNLVPYSVEQKKS